MPIGCEQRQANIGDKLPGGESDPLVGRTGSGSTVVAHIYIFTTWGILETKTSVDIAQN